MADPLSKRERSALMAKIRSRGNQSTEIAAEAGFRANHITGWRKHPTKVPGRPDFYFPRLKLAVFVDGCFWHACPKCGRVPKTRVKFWSKKIDSNRRHDARVRRQLRRDGHATMRIWEHDLKSDSWVRRLKRRLARLYDSKIYTQNSTDRGKPP